MSQDEGQGRARELIKSLALRYCYEGNDCNEPHETEFQHDIALITAALRAERIKALEAIDQGEVWSLFRRIIEQGGAIQQDYAAGKYPSYEHYSARLDEAARERADTFIQAIREQARRAGEE